MELSDTRAEIDSLMVWWRDAGVDTIIDEQPRNWLVGSNEAAAAALTCMPSAMIVSAAATHAATPIAYALPTTLAEFTSWLATDVSTLVDYPVHRRLAPEGPTAASLMIIADVPEAGDADVGTLLSGDVGGLLDKMLAAMGRDRASVYLATIAPARPANGRLDDAAEAILAPILRRHITLVAPQKLWLLGRAASRAVLGMDEVSASGTLHCVNQDGFTMSVIATVHPRILLREPKLKGRVWEDMKRLNEGPTE